MENTRESRTDELIKSRITPVSAELNLKLNTAFAEVVDRIKEKHLS